MAILEASGSTRRNEIELVQKLGLFALFHQKTSFQNKIHSKKKNHKTDFNQPKPPFIMN